MNYLQQFKSEKEFEKHLKNKYVESLMFMQKEYDISSNIDYFTVKKSTLPNAGNGVFTNKSFKKGDIICYYAPIVIYNRDTNHCIHNLDNFDEHKFKEYFTNDYVYTWHNITCIGSDYIPKNNMYIGHLINDNNYNPNKIYNGNKHNCIFAVNSFELTTDSFKDNIGLVVKAYRDIKEGEELFVYYGKSYWYDDIDDDGSRHMKIKKSLSK